MKRSLILISIFSCAILTAPKTEAINYKKAAYGTGVALGTVATLGSLLFTSTLFTVDLLGGAIGNLFNNNPTKLFSNATIAGGASTLGCLLLTKIFYDKYKQESKK